MRISRGVTLDTADHDAVGTVGGVVMTLLGHILKLSDEVATGEPVPRVEEIRGVRVAGVRLLPRCED